MNTRNALLLVLLLGGGVFAFTELQQEADLDDAGFAGPQLFALLDELKVGYLVAMPRNPALVKIAARHMHAVRSIAQRFGGTTTLHGEGDYRTRTWSRTWRVIFKAEVTDHPGLALHDNLRSGARITLGISSRSRLKSEVLAPPCRRESSRGRLC
jgi:hypothetical protein